MHLAKKKPYHAAMIPLLRVTCSWVMLSPWKFGTVNRHPMWCSTILIQRIEVIFVLWYTSQAMVQHNKAMCRLITRCIWYCILFSIQYLQCVYPHKRNYITFYALQQVKSRLHAMLCTNMLAVVAYIKASPVCSHALQVLTWRTSTSDIRLDMERNNVD